MAIRIESTDQGDKKMRTICEVDKKRCDKDRSSCTPYPAKCNFRKMVK